MHTRDSLTRSEGVDTGMELVLVARAWNRLVETGFDPDQAQHLIERGLNSLARMDALRPVLSVRAA